MTTLTLQDLSRSAQADLEQQDQLEQAINSAEKLSLPEPDASQSLVRLRQHESRPDEGIPAPAKYL